MTTPSHHSIEAANHRLSKLGVAAQVSPEDIALVARLRNKGGWWEGDANALELIARHRVDAAQSAICVERKEAA